MPRDTNLKITLYAVDELTGFISAVAFVRPSKSVAEVTPQAVRKKMKDKAFARAVDREAMLHGAELMGVDFDEHVAFVIQAMTDNAEALGLAGVPWHRCGLIVLRACWRFSSWSSLVAACGKSRTTTSDERLFLLQRRSLRATRISIAAAGPQQTE